MRKGKEMVKVYHKNAGIRATTGIWVFNNEEEALPTIEAYEEGKKENNELYDFIVEVQ